MGQDEDHGTGGLCRRVVSAPRPDDPAAAMSVISVELGEDEEVEWEWTHRAGHSIVTGYRIRQRGSAEPRGR